jgi:serine/threonine protein kinase
LREAKIIARLEHPGIVPVHDVGRLPDDRVFYTMKLVQGRRLDQYGVESSPVPERLRIFQKICEAVAFAHAHGVLHRDLKPQNIMVGKFGEVLVMDWGLAKVLNAEPVSDAKGLEARKESDSGANTSHGAVLGTPGYMAPEQARGEVAAVGPRADIYSLGAVLKFLLAGSGSTPKALAAIAAKATAEHLSQRYGSVDELASEIARYLDGLPVSAYPEGSITRMWRWAARNRAWILLILAYLVMRVLFIWWRG